MIQIPAQDIWFRPDQLLAMRVTQEENGWLLGFVMAYIENVLYIQYETQLAAQSVAQLVSQAVKEASK